MTQELNDRQEAFCQEYAKTRHATQSYIRAGYRARGKSAGVASTNLMKNPEVKARINELMKDSLKRTEISLPEILNSIKDMADDITQPGSVRMNALRTLAEHLGAFTQKVQVEDITPKKSQVKETFEMVKGLSLRKPKDEQPGDTSKD